MSDFRDSTSRSHSWDYSSFVRTYALYLDECLEYKIQGRRIGVRRDDEDEDDEELGTRAIGVRSIPVGELKTEHLFLKMQQLQQLLDRFLACRPTGAAKQHRVVIVALYPIVQESFQTYYDMTDILGALIDRLTDLVISDAAKLQEIFHRVSKQLDELDHFYNWTKAVGIARSSEYPEVEQIQQKKLDLLDEFIRDKLALGNIKSPPEVKKEEVEEETEPEPVEEDMNEIKALPPPDPEPEEEEKEEPKEEEVVETKVVQTEGDLLNLGEGAMTTEEHADNLALALFDGLGPVTTAGSVPALTWQAFNDDNGDWETTLVQTTTTLTSQKAAMAGGFDMLMLDGMYQQGENVAAAMSYRPTGSASSVALGSVGTPAMLALPAPPTTDGKVMGTTVTDPFAGSLAIAPPPFVQMSDMEKKQMLLAEEQMMWEKYRADGLQGHLGMMRQHQYPYNTTGGY